MATQNINNSPNKELREENLQTEGPVSEKDELKEAEQNTARAHQQAQANTTTELKNQKEHRNPEQHK